MPTCQMLVPLRFFYGVYGPVAKSTVPCFLNSCYFHNVGFPLWYAPAVPPDLGGTTQIGGGRGTLKKIFPALCAGVCAPNFKTVSAPMTACVIHQVIFNKMWHAISRRRVLQMFVFCPPRLKTVTIPCESRKPYFSSYHSTTSQT